MRKSVIRTDKAPKPGGFYSQAIKVGNLVYTSGLGGVDPATGKPVAGGIQAQVRKILEYLDVVLKEADTSLENAVKVNVFLADIDDFRAYNEAYSEYFDPDEPPARTTVQAGLSRGEFAVAIDVIAYVPER